MPALPLLRTGLGWIVRSEQREHQHFEGLNVASKSSYSQSHTLIVLRSKTPSRYLAKALHLVDGENADPRLRKRSTKEDTTHADTARKMTESKYFNDLEVNAKAKYVPDRQAHV